MSTRLFFSTLSETGSDSRGSLPGLAQSVADVLPGLALPEGKIITISGSHGNGSKPHTIGRSGGGAGIEIDDPQMSDRHYAVACRTRAILILLYAFLIHAYQHCFTEQMLEVAKSAIRKDCDRPNAIKGAKGWKDM